MVGQGWGVGGVMTMMITGGNLHGVEDNPKDDDNNTYDNDNDNDDDDRYKLTWWCGRQS